ncbi:hypothetical protein A2160_04615 [Candidatus Beckwithbacteria bacterium RBG_13_42_9]|uniref:Signal transduction histidine kinase subgroup 3 dimerisation and phosphoacceptor domain-containing protein n=1 Tax=Candidatus Beckwithbacteria bacterium RBG_13_42_9 TaxID=1797457 RepID=A0A1F5E3U9_9BACT|nr:MAG: hypothetical protein A2160_04615 [Candidatus Beckwithbacteria bacterium RBG_13_42_9]
MSNLSALKAILLTSGSIIAIFLVTKNPWTGRFSLQLTLTLLLGIIIYAYISRHQEDKAARSKNLLVLCSLLTVMLIATTGWFFSPFFFCLYLLGILLAFVFSPAVSLTYSITLVLLFSFNIGEVDLTYDFLVVLSLLMIFPLSLYLRKEYLRLKLGKVSSFVVNLRQPINDTKQLAYQLNKTGAKDKEKTVERIIASSEEALRILKEFERE